MKFLDGFLAMCAFVLSTITTATLYVTFVTWVYGGFGPFAPEPVAATVGPPAAAASATTANASVAQASDDPIEIRFEPITVIGHRGDANEHLAQSSTPVVN